ncbi:MAG: DNA-directed RNA polymerase subunit omega [Acidimicrobiia bacterium]|nr:DNA-directed RNA polymerase subunit omega [Acidimicrobiia bacterium]
MTERRNTLMEPRVEDLLGTVESKFTLVTLAARRAREINDYYAQLGHGVGRVVPPQITSVSTKPLSIALEEIDEGKIVARTMTDDEMNGTTPTDEASAAREALSIDEPSDSDSDDTGDAAEDAGSADDAGADDSGDEAG